MPVLRDLDAIMENRDVPTGPLPAGVADMLAILLLEIVDEKKIELAPKRKKVDNTTSGTKPRGPRKPKS